MRCRVRTVTDLGDGGTGIDTQSACEVLINVP